MTVGPVTEAMITVQFGEALLQLNALHIADIYQSFSAAFPMYDQVQPAGPMPYKLTHLDGSEPLEYEQSTFPRLRFQSIANGRVLMLQADRFSYGWQRNAFLDTPEEYPGFDLMLREFVANWELLQRWVAERFAIYLQPAVAEVAYINMIRTISADGERRRLSDIYSFLNPEPVSLIPPVPINGYSYSWNEKLIVSDGILALTATGPAVLADGMPSTMFSLAATFKLATPSSFTGELLAVRARIRETFARSIKLQVGSQ